MLCDHHEGLLHLGVAKAERRDGACDEGFRQLICDLLGGDHFEGGLVDIGEAEGSAACIRCGLLVLEQGGNLGLVRGVLSCDLADFVLVPLLGVLLATLLEIERGAGFRSCTNEIRSEMQNRIRKCTNETLMQARTTYGVSANCLFKWLHEMGANTRRTADHVTSAPLALHVDIAVRLLVDGLVDDHAFPLERFVRALWHPSRIPQASPKFAYL